VGGTRTPRTPLKWRLCVGFREVSGGCNDLHNHSRSLRKALYDRSHMMSH